MTDKALRQQAEQLAARPYSLITFQEELSDESGFAWVAMHPELEGCVSQGETEAEAIENLNEARLEYIFSLLRRGFDVPPPSIPRQEPVSHSITSR